MPLNIWLNIAALLFVQVLLLKKKSKCSDFILVYEMWQKAEFEFIRIETLDSLKSYSYSHKNILTLLCDWCQVFRLKSEKLIFWLSCQKIQNIMLQADILDQFLLQKICKGK